MARLKRFNVTLFSSMIVLMSSDSANANNDWTHWLEDSAFVPYLFSTDSLGVTAGGAGIIKGVGQPQASLFGTAMISSKGSYLGYVSFNNYQVATQWLLGGEIYQSQFNDYTYYLGQQAGNGSSLEDTTLANGEDSRYRLSFRYILPWGEAEQKGVKAAVSPTRTLTGRTPFSSGVSSIDIQPYFESRDLDFIHAGFTSEKTTALEVKFEWDNRDDSRNPSAGSRTRFDVTYAPEAWNESSWGTWEIENTHYWDLGSVGEIFDKQVVAFGVYTADTPTWEHCSEEQCQRPPDVSQVKLGGLYRLRSYDSGRYHGRSAMHYTAEYRVMPQWQPLGEWPIFKYYNVPWWQWVAFVDVGRVADDYNLKTLHTDMKWSAGGALRFQVEGVIVRAEMAWGAEQSSFIVMVNQPF